MLRRSTIVRTPRAFTIIELVMAFTLFALVLTATYNSIYHASQTKTAAKRRADLLRAGVSFLSRLDREIGAAYIQRGGGAHNSRTVFIGETADGVVPRDTLVLTCNCTEIWTFGLVDTNRIPHTEVAYDFIYSSDEGRTLLVRRQDDTLDSDPIDGGLSDALWPAIRGLDLRFLDPDDKAWKDSWDSRSRGGQQSPLPQAVEVTIWLAEPEDEGEDLINPLVLARTFVLPTVFPKTR